MANFRAKTTLGREPIKVPGGRLLDMSPIADELFQSSETTLCANLKLSRSLKKGSAAAKRERGSSVGGLLGGPLARRHGVWRQDQLRVVDDVADITVVADEADLAVPPFQPHQIAGLRRLGILEDRDDLAAIE